MSLSIADLKDWLVLAQLLGTAAVFLIALWLRSRFVPRDEFKAVIGEITVQLETKRGRLDAGEVRFERLDRALVELPKRDDLHDLGLHITRLAGAIDTLGARLEGHEKLVDRLDDSVKRHEAIFAEGRR